jgi:hypothetical protein
MGADFFRVVRIENLSRKRGFFDLVIWSISAGRIGSCKASAAAGIRARLSAVPKEPDQHWALAPAGTLVPRDSSDQAIQNPEISDLPPHASFFALPAHSLIPIRGTKVRQGLKPKFFMAFCGTAESRALIPAAAKAKSGPSAEIKAEPRLSAETKAIPRLSAEIKAEPRPCAEAKAASRPSAETTAKPRPFSYAQCGRRIHASF